MAKQSSHLRFQGDIGGVTYIKKRDGYSAFEKTKISKQRLASDPAFERFRQNGAEFSRAGKAARILRESVRNYLKYAKDRKTSARLTGQMLRVVKADNINKRGMRKVLGLQTEMLTGFNFNEAVTFSSVFPPVITSNINRTTGALEVSVPSFVPENTVTAPEGATHCQLVSAGVDINFDKEIAVQTYSDSGMIPLNEIATLPITLNSTVPAGSANPLFLVLGILFFEELNGFSQPIKSGSCNALTLLKVSGS